MTPPAERRTGGTSRLERWVRGLLIGGLVASLAWQWLVPWAARATLAGALRRAGWFPVRMEMASLGLNGVEIADLWLEGPGRIKARTVRADFTLGGLRHGRLHRLAVRGLRVDLPRTVWDAAPSGDGGLRLPFRELAVQDAVVRLEHELGKVQIGCDALLRADAEGRWTARLPVAEARWTGADGRTVLLGGAYVRAVARVSDGQQIESLDVTAEANAVDAPPARLTGVRFRVAKQGDDLWWRVAAAGQPVAFEYAEGRLAGVFGRPARPDGGGARLAGVAYTNAGFAVSAPAVTAGWRGTEEATVRFARAEAAYAPAGLRLEGLAGVAAWTGGVARAELAANALRWGEASFTGLAGVVTFAGDRLVATVTAAGPTGLTLRASGEFADGRLARIRASLPRVNVVEGDPLTGGLLARLAGWRCGGSVALAAQFGLADDREPDSAQFAVDIASATKDKLTLRGVRGCAEMESLAPLRSRGGQSLVVDEILFGALRLTDAELVYRIEGTNEIFVESAEWTAWGGRFSCTAFRFRPSEGAFRTTLFCENVEVGDVLRLTASGKVNGRGRLHGRLPVGVRWAPHPAVSVGAGFLYSVPGKGTLAVQDEALLEQLVTATAGAPSRNPLMDPVRAKVRDTFRDFEYSAARIDFVDGERGRPAGMISVTGKGNQKDGVPVDLKVRFAVDLL